MNQARAKHSRRLERAVQQEVARHISSTIVPLAWGLAGICSLFALAHLGYLSGALRVRMVAVTVGNGLVCAVTALWLTRRPPPLSAAHALQALVGAMPLLNGAAMLFWTLEPAQTTNMALYQLGAGFLMLSSAWFCAYTAAVTACVALAYHLAGGSRAWDHFLFMLASAVLGALLVHIIHLRAVKRTERTRILSDWQTQARLAQQETIAHLGRLAVVERDSAVFLQSCLAAVRATLRATWVCFERGGTQTAVGAPLKAAGHREQVRAKDEERDAVLTVHVPSRPLSTITPFLQSVVHLTAMSLRRAALEERRIDAERRLLHAQRMESVALLAGGVAHDFNNLLTVILGHADVLRFRRGLDSDARAALEQIVSASQLAARLTQQLLAFSRKQPQQSEIFDLRHVVTHLEAMLRRTIRENIAVDVQLTEAACTVNADRSQLEQVVMNLVVNARDALAGDGKISIDVSRYEAHMPPLPELPAGPYVVLAVRDDGAGIDAAVLPHIFEPFFTTKTHDRGTGLGLATVHGIVHQCGGTISVQSTRGSGTTFHVYVPYCDPAARAPLQSGLRPVPRSRPQRVLVVEDNDAVRSVVVTTLREAGYVVIEAGSGADALRASRSYTGDIDLLLSDVVMPELSGLELARQLLRERRELRVLFMSGHLGDDLSLDKIDAEPAPRLVQKPFTAAELLAAVEEALRGELPAQLRVG